MGGEKGIHPLRLQPIHTCHVIQYVLAQCCITETIPVRRTACSHHDYAQLVTKPDDVTVARAAVKPVTSRDAADETIAEP